MRARLSPALEAARRLGIRPVCRPTRAEAPSNATRMTAKPSDFASSHFSRDGADRSPRTRDIGGTASTEDTGKAIAAAV
jgi:hypothetical protein